MKNQYFGDVNDYIKYGLLRVLSNDGEISTSICWMLTPDDGKNDGKFTKYLSKPNNWRGYDPLLFDFLRECLIPHENRSVENIETANVLPNARFCSRYLTDSSSQRASYFYQLLRLSKDADLIFYDPDNGFEVKSKPYGRKGSRRYLYWHELVATTKAGHSALVYQHFPRVKREQYVTGKIMEIREKTGLENVIAFRSPHVVFFLVAQSQHAAFFQERSQLVAKRWKSQIAVV